MEVPAVPAEQVEAMGDGLARAAEDPRGLAVRDLGDEVAYQEMIEVRLALAVVGAEGLDGEEASALLAHEALHLAAVAAAAVEAAALQAEVARAGGGTGWNRTEAWLERHGKTPPGRAPVNG